MRIIFSIFIFASLGLLGCSSVPESETQPASALTDTKVLPNTTLMVKCEEPAEYGLNNYFLVNHKPVAERYNYLIVYIKSILINSLTTNQQHNNTEKTSLSNVFIPVWIPPPNWVVNIKKEDIDNLESVARWIALNYDYKCTRKLLQSTHLVETNHFYIASSLSPLSAENSNTLMARKLSDFGAEGNAEVIDIFFKNTTQPRKWTTQDMQNVFDLLDVTFNNSANKDTNAEKPVTGNLTDTEADNSLLPQHDITNSQKIESQTPPPPARLDASEN